MTLAVKFGDESSPSSLSGAIYLDVTTEWRRKYGGKVTSHPVEAGVEISDHFVSDNPKIHIKGVITSVDFSFIPSVTFLEGEPVINNNGKPQAVSVSGGGGNLRQFIPDVVSQFLPNIDPSIVMDTSGRTDHREAVESFMKELINGLHIGSRGKWENRMSPSTLFIMEGATPVPFMDNLIVTNFQVDEDVEKGEALWVTLDMERVRFVNLESAEAPKPARGSKTDRQTAPSTNKGTQPATPQPTPAERTRPMSGDVRRR